jgi:hypothetical protein
MRLARAGVGEPLEGTTGVDAAEGVEIIESDERVRETERTAEELEAAGRAVAVRVCTAVLDAVEEALAVTRTVEVLGPVNSEDEGARMVEEMIVVVLVGWLSISL